MRKRLISLLLVLVMVVSLGGVSFAFADDDTTGETVGVTDETGGSGDTTGDSDTVEDGDEVTEGGSATGDGDTTEDNDNAGDENAAEDDDETSDGSDSEDTDNSQDDSADAEETVGADMSVAFGVTETVQDTAVEEVSDETEEEDTGVVDTQSYEGSDYAVTVSYGAEAGIPEDAVLTVEEYATDSSAYLTYYEQIVEIYGWQEDNTENVRVFDIGLYVGGEEIEPDATVQVTITFAEQEDISGYTVIHFAGETEEPVTAEAETAAEDGEQTVSFSVDSFSAIATIAEEAEITKTLTVDASAEEVEGETYPTIQAAINYINTQGDKTGWTITVETGTYKRFTVLSGLDGLTIQAAEGASVTVSTWDGTESEDGSVPKRQESYYLYNGIYIMSQNVTLTGLTINVGWDVDVSYATTLRPGLSDFDLPNSSCWYVAGIRTTKADSADGLVIDSCHFTSSKQGDDSNTNYGVLTACHTFTVKNTTFDGFWQGISVMGDYYAVNAVSITGNTFTYCNRAISVYYKVAPADTSNMGTLSITNNTITGSSDVRSKIILHDVSSNGSMGNVIMSGNTFNYGFVLIVNFAESPDTINGATVASGEAKTAVFADNTWGKGSFYVESSEYYNSSSGYTGTITVDSPELAYYESPASDEGYWALNVDLDSSPYTGSYANPEGTTEYVISVIKEANEAGSHTLAFTFDDEEQLIWTLTAFKDAIYWASSDTTSVTVTKTWDDAEDQDGIRPESVTVELCKNGEATGVTAELSEDNDWTATFTGLATVYYDGLDENGNVVLADNVYTVEEATVTGYTTEITGSAAAGYTVTNSHTPETTSVTVTKAWDDEDDQDGLQPESVTVTLYAGGTEAATATLNGDNGWTYTFTGLAKYSAGTEIEYTVEEAAVTGYTSVITGSAAEGYVITNSHTPEQTTEETATPSPTPTDEPTETPTETEPTDPGTSATPVVVTPVPTGTAPTTGDESNALLWLGLLLLCACGAAAVTIVRKRKDQ